MKWYPSITVFSSSGETPESCLDWEGLESDPLPQLPFRLIKKSTSHTLSYVRITAYVWSSEDSSHKLVLLFHPVGCRNQTQNIKLGGKMLNTMSCENLHTFQCLSKS